MIEALYLGLAIGFAMGICATVIGLALTLDHLEKKGIKINGKRK
jgi:hypothetical protein